MKIAESQLVREKNNDLEELRGALKQAQSAELEVLEQRAAREREEEMDGVRAEAGERLEAAKAAV